MNLSNSNYFSIKISTETNSSFPLPATITLAASRTNELAIFLVVLQENVSAYVKEL